MLLFSSLSFSSINENKMFVIYIKVSPKPTLNVDCMILPYQKKETLFKYGMKGYRSKSKTNIKLRNKVYFEFFDKNVCRISWNCAHIVGSSKHLLFDIKSIIFSLEGTSV